MAAIVKQMARRYKRRMARLRLLLAFFALGLLVFAGQRLAASVRAGGGTPIVVGAAERAAARAEALALLGRAPTAAEQDALLETRIADELLYREALARGLDREDRGVRRRLVQNLAFLHAPAGTPEPAALSPAEEEALYREALALGMDKTDTVVRRKLVQRVRLEIESEARFPEPGDAELQAWLSAHPERAAAPPRSAFHHVFFDPARRGERAEADARRALAAGAAGAAGDPCLVPAEQALQSEAFVARLLGPAFAAAVQEAPLGAWTGPLRSSLGWHLVRVDAREPGAPRSFEAARSDARDALLAERGTAALERFLAERRARTRVVYAEAEAARR